MATGNGKMAWVVTVLIHGIERFGMTELRKGKHERHFHEFWRDHMDICRGEAHSMICHWARIPTADLAAIRAGKSYTDQARELLGK